MSMLASVCFRLYTDGQRRCLRFQIFPALAYVRRMAHVSWLPVTLYSEEALEWWLQRTEEQFRSKLDHQFALPQERVGRTCDAFRGSCLFTAALPTMRRAFQLQNCDHCDRCVRCRAYQDCLNAFRKGLLDEQLQGCDCKAELCIEKLPYIFKQLEADFQAVTCQLESEQNTFIGLQFTNHEFSRLELEQRTYKLCQPLSRPSNLLPIRQAVHDHWASFATFRERWQVVSLHHNQILALNPGGQPVEVVSVPDDTELLEGIQPDLQPPLQRRRL